MSCFYFFCFTDFSLWSNPDANYARIAYSSLLLWHWPWPGDWGGQRTLLRDTTQVSWYTVIFYFGSTKPSFNEFAVKWQCVLFIVQTNYDCSLLLISNSVFCGLIVIYISLCFFHSPMGITNVLLNHATLCVFLQMVGWTLLPLVLRKRDGVSCLVAGNISLPPSHPPILCRGCQSICFAFCVFCARSFSLSLSLSFLME